MKINSTSIITVILATTLSCCQQANKNLPCIDVNTNYPQKEIILTDIANISYLHLNSQNKEYLYSGSVQAISANKVMVSDARSGNILFFSKDGMPISYFNHKGNGPGEYNNAHKVFYDEETDDVFVIDPVPVNTIHVYSSTGEHKRDISFPKGKMVMNDIVSFDNNSFFFYDISSDYKKVMANEANTNSPTKNNIAQFYRISKTNGTILDSIKLQVKPLFLGINHNGIKIPGRKTILIKKQGGVYICNPENDTVFIYNNKDGLTPLIYKTPIASTMNPIKYLNNCVDVGNYQFIQIFTARAGDKYPGVFPTQYLMRNKETGEINTQKFTLPDYKEKEFFISPAEARISGLEDGVLFELDLGELKEANANNKLSGKLKELVDSLADDDNNIYVLVNFK